jgi:NTP pyrophosphatase (non-canonical NTP hydrolase)
MSEIKELTEAIIKFRDERDWEQFHNAKDLAMAISIEAGELLEAFLWKGADEAKDEKIEEELADIFLYGFLLAHKKGLDIKKIIYKKLETNNQKYPVEKAKGSARKYNEL